MEAKYYTKIGDGTVECLLCPHQCFINNGKSGICGVRRNIYGVLTAESYGKLCSVSSDPIEKKPLYHYKPTQPVLSIGSVGCNLNCIFCQNWHIARATINSEPKLSEYSPAEVANAAAKNSQNIGIAYTYNEPTIWFEFMLDCAKAVKEKNKDNIVVSNGFINDAPLQELIPYIDAFNIDLKAFTDEFYKKQTFSKRMPVLKSLKTIRNSGKHLEITNLIIPSLNDDIDLFKKMIDWIADELGNETVLHLSRYFPNYKMSIQPTPPEKLLELYTIANEKLHYVYMGNINSDEGQNTKCPDCNTLIIKRLRYKTDISGLSETGNCKNCGRKII